ncbi:MAG: ComEC/Rec2 family competence protein [Ferruginibacter sp.]
MSRPYIIPFWKEAPMVRLLFPLMLGIVAGWYLQIELLFLLFFSGCLAAGAIIFNYFPEHIKYNLRGLQGFVLHVFIFLLGAMLTWKADARHDKNWYGHILNSETRIIARVAEPWVIKAKSSKNRLEILYLVQGDSIIRVSGSILTYFGKDSTVDLPQAGSIIILPNKLVRIQNGGNPGSFNYVRYAAFRHIYHQAFIRKSEWKLVSREGIDAYHSFIFGMKEKVLKVLNTYIPGKDEKAIAAALIAGYKEDLDKELVQAYSNTGIVHIIAISGLHLGIVYVLLAWLLARVKYFRRQRWVQAVVIILCLWLFALVTGGSPSVLRSAVMFTMVVIGKSFFRSTSVYNALGASAFMLLVYNPYYLWDVGFQLSYVAVLGIVALQNPIFRLWYIPQKYLRKAWELLSVSIAAQIATLPFVLYYFHQFPVLFFVTNLFAVPLAAVLVYAELALLIFSWLKPVAIFLGFIIGKLIGALNFLVWQINDLPFALLDNIYANFLTSAFLLGSLVFLVLWVRTKARIFLPAFVFSLGIFSVAHLYALFTASKQEAIIIYNVPNFTAIDILYGRNYFYIGDSILSRPGILQNFHLKPSRNNFHASNPLKDTSMVRHVGNLWRYQSKTFLIAGLMTSYKPVPEPIPVDFLLLTHNTRASLASLLEVVKPGIIIADASNKLWKIDGWKKDCEELALPFHSVPQQGAYVLHLR